MNYFFYETILGEIAICADENTVSRLCFGRRCFPEAENTESSVIRKAYTQLTEYPDGSRQTFDLVKIEGIAINAVESSF
jgi:hypothetical protein